MRRDEDHGEGLGPEMSDQQEIVARVREDREHLRDLQRERRSRVLKALVVLAILVILIIFIISNSHSVAVDFVFLDRRPRLIWVMVACTILGAILGYLVGKPGKQVRFHRSKEERSEKKR